MRIRGVSLIKTLFLIMAAIPAMAQNANEIGGTLGWGSPYGGLSLHFSHNLLEVHALGVGMGISGAGFKYGAEYKLFINVPNDFNPYMGVAISQANGASNLNVNVNADTAVYNVKAGSQFTPRVGFRYSVNQVKLYLNAGYGIVLAGGGVEYVSGSRKESVKAFAEAMGIGGLEVSGSTAIAF